MSSSDEYFRIKDLIEYSRSIVVHLPSGTPAGTEMLGAPQFPPTNEVFYISLLRLVTPSDVSANIIVDTKTKTDMLALHDDQVLRDRTYITREIWGALVRVKKVNIKVKILNTLKSDRTAMLQFCGKTSNKLF